MARSNISRREGICFAILPSDKFTGSKLFK
jgi:hypothetical protein